MASASPALMAAIVARTASMFRWRRSASLSVAMERTVTFAVMGALESRALSPVLGVEVSGADFTRPLSTADQAELHGLFQRHRLLLFRGQELSDADHLRLCGYVLPVHEQIGYMSNTEVQGFHPDFKLLFHSDFAFTPYQLLGISLYATDLGADAAPTCFVNTEAA